MHAAIGIRVPSEPCSAGDQRLDGLFVALLAQHHRWVGHIYSGWAGGQRVGAAPSANCLSKT